MRDNSEPLLAIPDGIDPADEPARAGGSPGSGPTEVAEPATDEPVLASAADGDGQTDGDGHGHVDAFDEAAPESPRPADSARQDSASSDTRELGSVPKRYRSQQRSHSGSRFRAALPFDPLTRIYAVMERERRVGMSIGLAGALIVHGAGAAHGYSSLLDLGAFAASVRSAVIDDVRATYAVEVNKPPPPPPTPEPEPEKPQPQQRAPSTPQNAQQEKPPAPAQAAKVLTADPDPNEPLDLTDQGFVSGDGDRFAGGVTSATGTSKTAVRDLNAKPGGVVGGKGTAAAPPPPPKEDLSRPATPASRDWGDCGFPAEADVEQIDFMRLSVVVTVGTDGRAQSVTVLKDPGYGFGNQARQCALRKSYTVGLNVEGKPVVTTTPPFIVTFRR